MLFCDVDVKFTSTSSYLKDRETTSAQGKERNLTIDVSLIDAFFDEDVWEAAYWSVDHVQKSLITNGIPTNVDEKPQILRNLPVMQS